MQRLKEHIFSCRIAVQSPKLLEQKGLALNGVGVASVNIGLGRKTCVAYLIYRGYSY
jgi:hypothetical protein